MKTEVVVCGGVGGGGGYARNIRCSVAVVLGIHILYSSRIKALSLYVYEYLPSMYTINCRLLLSFS